MKTLLTIVLLTATVCMPIGCGPSMKSIIEAKVPEVKTVDLGTYDLGEFKTGQATPFRISPAVHGRHRCTVGFKPYPANRHFNIVLDDGRIFKVDDDNDLKKIADMRLDRQSFYLEFKQDMRMVLVVFDPNK